MKFQKLLKQEMTRKEFLGLGAFAVASTFGIVGLIRELASHAATPTADVEAENGTLANGATAVTDSTASGGKAVKFGSATSASPTPGLFFSQPADIIGRQRKYFAHYFGPYPRSFDNLDPRTSAAENYRAIFNNPADTHALDTHTVINADGTKTVVVDTTTKTYGGRFRDRPQVRAPIAGDYALEDCRVDIRQARSVGIDGFFPDMLGLSGSNWDHYVDLANAADALYPDGSFKVTPMIDGNGGHVTTTDKTTGKAIDVPPATCAASIAKFAKRPCAWNLADGRWVCAIFKPEAKTKAYWDAVAASLLSVSGIKVAWLGSYVGIGSRTNYPNHWGAGPWGYGADPAIITAATNQATAIKAASQVFLAPVVPQDIRPLSDGLDPAHGLYDNAVGTGSIRAGWKKAITQAADYVQLVTWNDYSETPSNPSANNGWVNLEISAYYATAWKNNGVYPAILKDAVFLSHRNQNFGAPLSSGQTKTLKQWPRGNMTVEANKLEVLTYLTAPGDVTVKVGALTYTYAAPAGEFSYLAPNPTVALAAGSISATVKRSTTTVASVTSPIPFYTAPVNDDMGYYRMSSVRGTSGQYVPFKQTPVLPTTYTLA